MKKKSSPIKHIVYFAWPSNDSKFLTYWEDQRIASNSDTVLFRLYSKVYQFYSRVFEQGGNPPCGHRIHLMCHSMGNQVLASFMQSIHKRQHRPIFHEIILLHADVKNNIFEKGRPFEYLHELGERIHIYINKSDDALRISRFTKNFSKRLGKSGIKNYNKVHQNITTITTIDASDVKASKPLEAIVDHWGYLYRKRQIKDIIEVLEGRRMQEFSFRELDESKTNHYYLKPAH